MSDKNRAEKNQPVSPAARKLAEELGIDLGSLKGSGSRGRILVADVEQAECGARKNLRTTTSGGYRQKISLPEKQGISQSVKIRHLLARKMEEAWKDIYYKTKFQEFLKKEYIEESWAGAAEMENIILQRYKTLAKAATEIGWLK